MSRCMKDNRRITKALSSEWSRTLRKQPALRRFALAAPIALAWLGASGSASALQGTLAFHGHRRLMPGGTASELAAVEQMGFQVFLDKQLEHLSLTDIEDAIAGGPGGINDHWELVNSQPLDIDMAEKAGTITQEGMRAQMRYARIWRWIYSEQGFYETMTWEWDRHFNIDQLKRGGWLLFPYWNRVVTRKHAFGQFRDLLHASAGENSDRAAAMLHYLDSLQNICLGPNEPVNENYGRELPELHALGTDPQIYDEDDVRALSKILSGRVFDPGSPDPSTIPPDPLDFGMVLFRPAAHCAADRDFLGVTLPGSASDNSQALAALDLMVDKVEGGAHICAEFIARKLVAALLTDVTPTNPTHQAVIDGAVADAALAFGQDGDIKAMIRAILTDANLTAILTPVGNSGPMYKYMEPTKFVTTLLHASQAELNHKVMEPISEVLTGLAERPYAYSPPIGYPLAAEDWVQDQTGRWDFAFRLFEEDNSGADGGYCTIPGVSVDVDALYADLTPPGFNLATCGAQVNEILTGGNLNDRDELILQLYAERVFNNGLFKLDEIKWRVLALGAMAPSYSLY